MPDKITKNKKFKVVLPGLIIFLIVFGFLVFEIKKRPQELEVKASPGTTWIESCLVTKGGCFCNPAKFGYKCGGGLTCTPSCTSRQNATYTNPSSTCIYSTVGSCHTGDACGFEDPNPVTCWVGTGCSLVGGNCEYTCLSGFENCDNNGPLNGCECQKPAGCCDGNIRRYDCSICYGASPTTCNSAQTCANRVGCSIQDCSTGSYCSAGYCATCPGNCLNCDQNPNSSSWDPGCNAGCEEDVSSDNNNCGGCGITCGATENCINGLCVSTSIADVWGWAWANFPTASETGNGWISFNSSNCDSDGNGITDNVNYPQCPVGLSITSYGVKIDSGTGNLSGYAWVGGGQDAAGNSLPVIGWIKFDAPLKLDSESYPTCPVTTCPDGSPNYSANLNLTTKKVTGWARACAGTVNGDCISATRTDGWDGWILLGPIVKSGADLGVNYVATSSGELHNWAWGSDVVGWISFWGSNSTIPSPSNAYTVFTSLVPPDSLPYVVSPVLSGETYCNINSGEGRVGFSWTYKDDDGDNQGQYHLQVSTVSFSDPGFGPEDLVVDSVQSQPGIPDSGTGTSAVSVKPTPSSDPTDLDIGYNDTFYWRVRVKAATGSPLWSDWTNGPSFTTKPHAFPWVDFTPADEASLPFDSGVVQFCSIAAGVCPTDLTWCYDINNNKVSCNTWSWTLWGGTPSTSSDPNPLVTYSAAGDKRADLKVKDLDNNECTITHKFELTSPLTLPEWKEVPPF